MTKENEPDWAIEKAQDIGLKMSNQIKRIKFNKNVEVFLVDEIAVALRQAREEGRKMGRYEVERELNAGWK